VSASAPLLASDGQISQIKSLDAKSRILYTDGLRPNMKPHTSSRIKI